MTPIAVGVDFGTTNSVVAFADAEGHVAARRFDTVAGAVEAYRSALLFFRARGAPRGAPSHISGQDALSRALEMDGEHRFLQSLKTYLSSRAFQETRLLGRRFGPLPPGIEEQVGAADNDLLDAWSDRLLDARTVTDVFLTDRQH